MALSLLTHQTHSQQQKQQPQQHSNFGDFLQLFDSFPLQQQKQQLQQQQLQHQHQHQHQHHHQQQQHLEHNLQQQQASILQLQQQQQIQSAQMENTNNNNHTNPYHQMNGNANHSSGHINQNLNNSTRTFFSGYHHQHIGADYEQVINFVDSPPNSEESWPDEHSKGSPGPQIIDVQTIYSQNNGGTGGSRKRRMDWDSLDIEPSGGNTTEATQSEEIANKISHHEKEKHKREKLTGRASWTEDIGFDLNAEFNSNSYLNNETFLSFSPSLTVLKQEPQTEQGKANKSILNSGNTSAPGTVPTKIDKLNLITDTAGLDSIPDKSAEKTDSGHEECVYNAEKARSHNNNSIIHQLAIADTSKIENSPQIAPSSHADDHKFQYILAAATSIATKNNEETLTYLNQGQSYEIKLKKIGDLSFYRDKILKSVIKICFHERRLQFMEREQMQQWQASRPGDRIIEVDVPLSYGLCHVSQPLNPSHLNTVEVFWDPLKEVGVYIKVNCISTEFTPKKHGGEKGVPFRLQIETYIENTNSLATSAAASSSSPVATAGPAQSSPCTTPGNLTPTNNNNISNNNSNNSNNNSNNNNNNINNNTSNNNSSNTSVPLIGGKQPVHAAACQIKVFKLKGADRKHKQDREKIQRRPQLEQDKFQPSYECTIMNDIPFELITTTPPPGCFSPEYMKIWPNSPVHIPKYDGILPYANASPTANTSPIAINSVTSTNSQPNLKLMDPNMVSPLHVPEMEALEYPFNIMPDSTPAQVAQWLTAHRLTTYLSTFAHFSGSDVMRMSKEDLIQICGLADGIRMFNILRAKAITPRLTIYVSLDSSSYNAIYLVSNTSKELIAKLFKLPGFYEIVANSSNNGSLDNGGSGALYNSWNIHSKYSGSGSNIFSDVCKSLIYLSGPSGVHVTVTDEVLNNDIKDGSLYALEVQSGKVVMKLINKNDN